MRLNQLGVISTSLLLWSGNVSAALPPQLKPTAEEYEKAQKSFDASVAAQTKAALNAYLAVLSLARKREETAKRAAAVAGIDAEIAAVKSGPIKGRPPEQLPPDLGVYRDRFIAGTQRAAVSNDSARKHSTAQYLKWLSSMETAVRGKDEALLAAILAEKKRVLETARKGSTVAK